MKIVKAEEKFGDHPDTIKIQGGDRQSIVVKINEIHQGLQFVGETFDMNLSDIRTIRTLLWDLKDTLELDFCPQTNVFYIKGDDDD